MLTPFIDVISLAIGLLETALMVWIILGLLIHFNVVNASQPLVATILGTLNRLFTPMLAPIRRLMPNLGGIDLSPVMLFLLFQFIQSALVHWF